MTDYLDAGQVQTFLAEAKSVLNDGGKLIVTFPDTYGLGFFYVRAARLIRGVEKYTYSKKQIIEKLKRAGFTDIEIVKLNSWLHIPWAYMAIAQ